jgi:4-hydroxy-tetrahydrodipicolinate reductase
MGQMVVRAVEQAPDLHLVGAFDIGFNPADLAASGAQVAVDFTVPEATEANVHLLIDLGIHAVVGTSGWDQAALDRLEQRLAAKPQLGVLIGPNFALGAVLAMAFAAKAAPYFQSAEVVEMHHPDKLDAPSGTAQHTAAGIAAARLTAGVAHGPDATSQSLSGARGAVVDGIHVHALRLRGAVAHEEIVLGNVGEILTIRHDSLDRVSFMPGVLLAIRAIASHTGLTVGLEQLLDL